MITLNYLVTIKLRCVKVLYFLAYKNTQANNNMATKAQMGILGCYILQIQDTINPDVN